jgi:hypothetical protein
LFILSSFKGILDSFSCISIREKAFILALISLNLKLNILIGYFTINSSSCRW